MRTMSKPNHQPGPCPLQDAIEHIGLARVIAGQAITRMMVSEVRFLPDTPFREAQLPSFENPNIVPRQAQLAEYGDMIVVFKVLERSQE